MHYAVVLHVTNMDHCDIHSSSCSLLFADFRKLSISALIIVIVVVLLQRLPTTLSYTLHFCMWFITIIELYHLMRS